MLQPSGIPTTAHKPSSLRWSNDGMPDLSHPKDDKIMPVSAPTHPSQQGLQEKQLLPKNSYRVKRPSSGLPPIRPWFFLREKSGIEKQNRIVLVFFSVLLYLYLNFPDLNWGTVVWPFGRLNDGGVRNFIENCHLTVGSWRCQVTRLWQFGWLDHSIQKLFLQKRIVYIDLIFY